jgi:hypothetical protein
MRLLILIFSLSLLHSLNLNAQADNKVVSGIVLLNDNTPADFKVIAAAVKKDWNLRLDSVKQAEKTLILYTTNATIMLANMDYPASPAEIKSAAEGAWMWQAARDEAPRHQSQVVISVIGADDKPVYLYKLFTKTAAAVLDNSRSCGVYMPAQYVLQSKEFYLQAAHNLEQVVLPIYCWVYFGMFLDGGASCAYTHGLTEFGMPDLEIVKSTHSMQEVHAVLYDAVSDALHNNNSLRNGSEIETLEGEKITLKLSKATYLEGETLKVAY